jgi:hypothetical protein
VTRARACVCAWVSQNAVKLAKQLSNENLVALDSTLAAAAAASPTSARSPTATSRRVISQSARAVSDDARTRDDAEPKLRAWAVRKGELASAAGAGSAGSAAATSGNGSSVGSVLAVPPVSMPLAAASGSPTMPRKRLGTCMRVNVSDACVHVQLRLCSKTATHLRSRMSCGRS